MTFSRDDMAAYEKQPQKVVADTLEHVLTGATPALVADAATIAAVAAGKTDATPAAKAGTSSVDTPSGDEVDSDQSVTGDGTSDENADSSTASADPSGESETDEEGEGKTGDEAPANQRTPKKGSAAERIQELLDLTEGYKEYGKLKDGALKEALAELARLKAGNGASTSSKSTSEAPPAEVDDPPMPDLADEDINYDTDKLREKTQKWAKTIAKNEARRAVREENGESAKAKLVADVNAKSAKFAVTHKDWETVVTKNQVLLDNQLAIPASLTIAQSDYTAELLYAFGKDDALAIRVAKMSPAQQVYEIGKMAAKIEAKLEAERVTNVDNKQPNKDQQTPVAGAKSTKQKSLTQAPPPPTPTKAAGRPAERDETDPNMSMEEFAHKHRDKKQAHRATMRKARGLSS